MEQVHKLENMIEGWLKPLPHLSTDWRKWIAKNVWWITLIGVVISVMGIFGLLTALSIFGAATSFYGAMMYSAVVQTHGGFWFVFMYASLALLALTTVIEAMAISPLKVQHKKGWDLLFFAYLAGVASGVVTGVFNIDVMGLIGTAISAVIGAYFLFEVRSYFK